MRTKTEIDRISQTTKRAWEENWQDVDIERILEIFQYPRVEKQIEIYKKYLPKDKKILEGGCGLGPYLIYLSHMGYDVIGIDYNYKPLVKIIRYDKSVSVCCADVTNIPFPNVYFGAYLSLGVIEHFIEGPGSAIKEAYRVLIPGGYFIIQVPRFSIFNMIEYPIATLKKKSILRKLFKKMPKNIYWEQHFSISKLAGILKKNNFSIIGIIPIDHEHALLTFCGLLRDKDSYDGANAFGIVLGNMCQRYMPWSTAAEMVFICKKENPPETRFA